MPRAASEGSTFAGAGPSSPATNTKTYTAHLHISTHTQPSCGRQRQPPTPAASLLHPLTVSPPHLIPVDKPTTFFTVIGRRGKHQAAQAGPPPPRHRWPQEKCPKTNTLARHSILNPLPKDSTPPRITPHSAFTLCVATG